MLTAVYIYELPPTTVAETSMPAQVPNTQSKAYGAVQEVPETIMPFNGIASTKLERKVQVNDFGIVLVNDSFTIMNNQTDSTRFNTLNVSYPSEYFEHATPFSFAGGKFNISSAEQNATDITYEMLPTNSGLTDIRIFFPSVESGFLDIAKNDELKFYVMFAFADRISVRRDNVDQRFTLNWTLVPILTFNATFEGEYKAPSVASLKNETLVFDFPLENYTLLYNTNYTTTGAALKIANVTVADLFPVSGATDIATTSNLTKVELIPRVAFEYSSARPMATCLETERIVRLVSWGELLITERVLFQVNGAEPIGTKGLYGLERVTIIIPQNASQLVGTDALGNLTLSESSSKGRTNVDLRFRHKIRGTDTYEFTVSYRVPLEDYITVDEDEGLLTIELPLANGFNWTIQELTEYIILPEGSSFVLPENASVLEIEGSTNNQVNMAILDTQKESGFAKVIRKETLTLKGQTLFEYHNGKLTLVYRSSSLSLIQIPLTISLLLFALGFVYVGLHHVRIGVAPTHEVEREIPTTLLQDFVTTYDDKTALEERLRRLDERMRRRRITRTVFQREKRVLDRELRQTEAKVKTFKEQLREESRRYREMIEELEISETEKVSLFNSVEELTDRRRKGRISKEVFERLQNEYARRLQRTANQIDRILVELREEIELGVRR